MISVSEFNVCGNLQNPLVAVVLNIVTVRSQYESFPAKDATGNYFHRDFTAVFFFSQAERF